MIRELGIAAVILGLCACSKTDKSSSETHFVACSDDTKCHTELGADYTCSEGKCRSASEVRSSAASSDSGTPDARGVQPEAQAPDEDRAAPTYCGDGRCDVDETTASCPADCDGFCGDGLCGRREDALTCPADCGSAVTCGDGVCGSNETAATCYVDCGSCGDAVCAPEEHGWCIADCDPCRAGLCTPGDAAAGCPAECPAICGNGACDPGETAFGCPEDCGFCGDGRCESAEDSASCPGDCSAPASCDGGCGIPRFCGDGLCTAGETRASCPADCT